MTQEDLFNTKPLELIRIDYYFFIKLKYASRITQWNPIAFNRVRKTTIQCSRL